MGLSPTFGFYVFLLLIGNMFFTIWFVVFMNSVAAILIIRDLVLVQISRLALCSVFSCSSCGY